MDVMLQRIIELIGNKHGSTKELATALGISGNSVTNWKNGHSMSYKKYASQIAEFYNVSLDWLSGLTDEKGQKEPATNNDDGFEERLKVFMSLSPEAQDKALDYMRFLASQEASSK